MKTFGLTLTLLLAALGATGQEGGLRTTGHIESGGQLFDNDTDSSRLNEYRDLRNSLYVPSLRLDVDDDRSGRFLELSGFDVTRDDRAAGLRLGSAGKWGLGLSWTETPHRLSHKAQTPFSHAGNGLLQLPSTIPITFKKLATGTSAADVAGVVASDDRTAAYLMQNLRATPLGTQRDSGDVELRYSALEAVRFRLGYRTTGKTGSKVSYGPIGDRPPRTLNVELAEPVDYRTQDLRFEAEHLGKGYEVQLSYLISDFSNDIDTLTWQNVYASPTLRSDTDAWDRAVSTFGRRPLAPDNQYRNATVTVGAALPMESRLTATAAYGRMEQDQELLPYSYNSGILVSPALPRSNAAARIDTSHFQAVYSISPVKRVELRASYRFYDLENKTPEDHWWYVTSDTPNLNGSVTFKNKRVNEAFGYDTRNARLEATWRPKAWRSSFGVGYEREQVDRTHREADTKEDKLSASWRARPTNGVMLRARYTFGNRDGGEYDWGAPRESYWYSPSDVGTDNDNPQFAFLNHPDMRRYDVSDRRRHQLDGSASLTRSAVTATASVRYRKDDFDSDVEPIRPLSGTGREEAATTPGDQLGRLDDERLQYTLDLAYSPGTRFSANVFASWETARSLQRNMEFNENNKMNPSAVGTAELGPWTRAGNEWTADSDDRTVSVGAGARYVLVPEKVTVAADVTVVRGKVDIEYAGYGVTNWDGVPFADNHQFGFRTPPTMRNDADVFGLSLEYKLNARVGVSAGYTFDRFRLEDWQQASDTPWRESLGSEVFTRDTSRSNQWGNRLINLGSYLAPGYDAHIGYLTLTYRF